MGEEALMKVLEACIIRDVKPGDAIVLRVTEPISDHAMAILRRSAEKVSESGPWEGVRFMVLPYPVDLAGRERDDG